MHYVLIMRFIGVILCAMFPVVLCAQQERGDSLRVSKNDTVPSFMLPVERVNGVSESSHSIVSPSMEFSPEYKREISSLATDWRIHGVDVPMPGVAGIVSWQGGSLWAHGGAVSMPGMMGVESGSLSLSQDFGRFTFTGAVTATKYGYFRGLQTGYGFYGSLGYRISDRWSVTVFGSYSTGLHPLTPAMAGYMSAPTFGGYASYDINEHWGVSVGAQATRSLVTNRWEAQPIVQPYYRFNKNVSIGVDVGGIMYNVVKDYVEGKRRGGGNPVMAPPRQGPPPVAPRR